MVKDDSVDDRDALGTNRNVKVFLEVSAGPRPLGRMEFELFYDVTPKTCENFRALCTGEMGVSPISQKPLHLKNTIFHRVIRGFMAQVSALEQKTNAAAAAAAAILVCDPQVPAPL